MDQFVFVPDDAEIRQGDVIRCASDGESEPRFGVVLTADCDIAQQKAGDNYTWLKIVRSQDYLEQTWAPEQLRRLRDRQSRAACDSINAILKRSNLDLSPLMPNSLIEWLQTTDPVQLITQISGSAPRSNDRLVAQLQAIQFAAGTGNQNSNLTRLRKAWNAMGRDEKSQRQSLRDAFDSERGFPDYILVPELPLVNGIGFVVLLRSLSTISAVDLYQCQADAKISGKSTSFYRIGRFSDALRFSIAQKVAFLFSRIGMPTHYEQSCAAAADLTTEAILASLEET